MKPGSANLLLVAALGAWWILYRSLSGISDKLVGWSGIDVSSYGGWALRFFFPEKTRQILAKHPEGLGSVAAALLGMATPFCSCSAVPLPKLLGAFFGIVALGILLVGWTFNAVLG